MEPMNDDEPDYKDYENLDPDENHDPLDGAEEEDEEIDEEELRYVQIKLKPSEGMRPLQLLVKYTPADVDDPRNFPLPLKLYGHSGEMASLNVVMKGVGVKPKFLLKPTLVNFRTKVIAKGSKPLPFHQDITIENPDVNKVRWHVNRSTLDDTRVFQMNPTEGHLEPACASTIRITFNPLEAQLYEFSIPLFLEGSKEPYLTVELKGEGTDAKIFFDRREVILPCTPLDIAARATFTVSHNGYENLELKPKIANEVGKLPVELKFHDG
jgi:hypothetical protein